MSAEILFLTWEELEALHRRQLELYGGLDGYTDRGVVEAAFNRPLWTSKYTDADVAELVAEYWFGLATTQGFCDGNKRTATQCAAVFLEKNGYRLSVPDEELFPIALNVAVGKLDRELLADWIAEHLIPRG